MSHKRRHNDHHSSSEDEMHYKVSKKNHSGSGDSNHYSKHKKNDCTDGIKESEYYSSTSSKTEDHERKRKKRHDKSDYDYSSYEVDVRKNDTASNDDYFKSKRRDRDRSEKSGRDYSSYKAEVRRNEAVSDDEDFRSKQRDYDEDSRSKQRDYDEDFRSKQRDYDEDFRSKQRDYDEDVRTKQRDYDEDVRNKRRDYDEDFRSKRRDYDEDFRSKRRDHYEDFRSKQREHVKSYSHREKEGSQAARSNDHDNISVSAVVDKLNQNARNLENGSLQPNKVARQDGNEGRNASEVNRAPKKMVSGAYIPPAKLRLMQQEITDKGSIEYQKISWEALKKSINGLTNKINTSNIADIVKELFKENIIRGRGVLTRALMQAQALSPTFTHVYAALVAIINTKFPEISELLLKRLTLQFKRGFRRNDKQACLSSVRFIAHLLNQQVAHEVLALEVLTLLLENPTDHSVEVAIALLKECGKKLKQLSSNGFSAVYTRLLHVLHEASIDKRTQYMVEVMFAVIKDKFKDYPSVVPELDLVEEGDKFTHLVTLDEAVDAQELLNVFQFDPDYEANEERYKSLVKEILGESDSEESGGSDAEESGSEDESGEEGSESQQIVDMTETNLVALRRNIYLTIQSSLDFEECAHKLLKMELKPGEIMEMCYMILDCCAQQRTYEKFYGLLAQRFCQLNKVYLEPFMEIFRNSYETIHRLETNKLRNVAKFFAHLLYTDAIHWNVLSNIRLNENDTTSSSRIFIKILFQELCEYMGLPALNARVKDATLQEAFDGLFPRDNPHNTRFAINFFTSIGLGGLTDELREHLKTAPKNPVVAALTEKPPESSSEDSSSSSSSSTSSSSSSDSDTEDEEPPRNKKKSRQKNTDARQKRAERSGRELTPVKDMKNNRSSKKSSDNKKQKHRR